MHKYKYKLEITEVYEKKVFYESYFILTVYIKQKEIFEYKLT